MSIFTAEEVVEIELQNFLDGLLMAAEDYGIEHYEILRELRGIELVSEFEQWADSIDD